MKFYINTLNDNGSGMKYNTKEEFMKEIGLMIDDCIANGGTYISFDVDADASCFCNDEDDEDELTDEELEKMNNGLDDFSLRVKDKRRKCPHGYWKTNKGIKLSIDDVDPRKDYGGYYCELERTHVTPIACADCKKCEVK